MAQNLYGPRVRMGNWNEDIYLEEVRPGDPPSPPQVQRPGLFLTLQAPSTPHPAHLRTPRKFTCRPLTRSHVPNSVPPR